MAQIYGSTKAQVLRRARLDGVRLKKVVKYGPSDWVGFPTTADDDFSRDSLSDFYGRY